MLMNLAENELYVEVYLVKLYVDDLQKLYVKLYVDELCEDKRYNTSLQTYLNVQQFMQRTFMQTFVYVDMLVHRHACTQTCLYIDMLVCK